MEAHVDSGPRISGKGLIGKFHSVGEVYRGDPYDLTVRVMGTQVGFRHIFSPNFQIDGTIGSSSKVIHSSGFQWAFASCVSSSGSPWPRYPAGQRTEYNSSFNPSCRAVKSKMNSFIALAYCIPRNGGKT